MAIAFDSRRMSPEFADEAACCLAANGIKAYVFESLRPTPELSFAVRELGCISGINITASHNPPEYNGYKVYWEDGAQITPVSYTHLWKWHCSVKYRFPLSWHLKIGKNRFLHRWRSLLCMPEN